MTDNLKWDANTQYICSKAIKRMWTLRRLKSLGADLQCLKDVYEKEIRSILEFAVPVWHNSISKKNEHDLERVQKTAFNILGVTQKLPYADACASLGLPPLCDRRNQLSINFAKKELKKVDSIFEPGIRRNTRSGGDLVKTFKCRTKRFQNSSLPSLSEMNNK